MESELGQSPNANSKPGSPGTLFRVEETFLEYLNFVTISDEAAKFRDFSWKTGAGVTFLSPLNGRDRVILL